MARGRGTGHPAARHGTRRAFFILPSPLSLLPLRLPCADAQGVRGLDAERLARTGQLGSQHPRPRHPLLCVLPSLPSRPCAHPAARGNRRTPRAPSFALASPKRLCAPEPADGRRARRAEREREVGRRAQRCAFPLPPFLPSFPLSLGRVCVLILVGRTASYPLVIAIFDFSALLALTSSSSSSNNNNADSDESPTRPTLHTLLLLSPSSSSATLTPDLALDLAWQPSRGEQEQVLCWTSGEKGFGIWASPASSSSSRGTAECVGIPARAFPKRPPPPFLAFLLTRIGTRDEQEETSQPAHSRSLRTAKRSSSPRRPRRRRRKGLFASRTPSTRETRYMSPHEGVRTTRMAEEGGVGSRTTTDDETEHCLPCWLPSLATRPVICLNSVLEPLRRLTQEGETQPTGPSRPSPIPHNTRRPTSLPTRSSPLPARRERVRRRTTTRRGLSRTRAGRSGRARS